MNNLDELYEDHDRTSLNDALIYACLHNYLDRVEYLLIVKGAEYSIEKLEQAFCKAAMLNRTDIVNFFIFDYNLPQSTRIDSFLESDNNFETKEIFRIRDEKNILNDGIPAYNLSTIKRIKI